MTFKDIGEKFEDDCESFARAAEKFHKILGNDTVDLELWKKRQNLRTYTLEKMDQWKAENNGEQFPVSGPGYDRMEGLNLRPF